MTQAPLRWTPQGRIRAVRVGPAVTRTWQGRTFVTGAAKDAVQGPVWAHRLGLDGDQQGNRAVHGGPEKAVLLYAAAHYAEWAADGFEVPEGGFFENLTVDGLTESDVWLGDTWQIGEAGPRVQITQPRRPCRTLADCWDRATLPVEVQQTGRTGWYVRVLRDGPVQAGDRLTLVERLSGSVSAAEANRVMNVDRGDSDGIRRLLASPELPAAWRDKLQRRLVGELEDDSARLEG